MTCSFLVYLILTAIFLFFLRWFLRKKQLKHSIGIFHLYCSSGGGGERVLWHTVEILLKKYPKYSIYIYTHGEHDDSLRTLLKVKTLFQIDLISNRQALERLEFVPLSLAPLVEAKKYPILTLLMQNLMSMIVGLQAASKLVPEVYMETVGFTYTLPLFKLLFSCNVITYVHYPTISNDMINNVETSSHASFNNREIFVRSSLLRQMKLVYYKILACLYGFAGRRADLVLANSSWTCAHLESLWKTKVHVVYPPCDVTRFKSKQVNRDDASDDLRFVSIAQFRPEKNQEVQIEAFDMFLNRTHSSSKLTIYGGCRNLDDQKRVDYLVDLIHRLDLESRVNIVINAPFDELLEGVQKSDVALHTMKNEHFGIVLLEFMAAGLITVAHNSGGPKSDIIDNGLNGFLCNDVSEFADKMQAISKMSHEQRDLLRKNAMRKADKFSVQVFEQSIIEKIDGFFKNT